jgi:hypothetical protein
VGSRRRLPLPAVGSLSHGPNGERSSRRSDSGAPVVDPHLTPALDVSLSKGIDVLGGVDSRFPAPCGRRSRIHPSHLSAMVKGPSVNRGCAAIRDSDQPVGRRSARIKTGSQVRRQALYGAAESLGYLSRVARGFASRRITAALEPEPCRPGRGTSKRGELQRGRPWGTGNGVRSRHR